MYKWFCGNRNSPKSPEIITKEKNKDKMREEIMD
jgi:hypothetical protein